MLSISELVELVRMYLGSEYRTEVGELARQAKLIEAIRDAGRKYDEVAVTAGLDRRDSRTRRLPSRPNDVDQFQAKLKAARDRVLKVRGVRRG